MIMETNKSQKLFKRAQRSLVGGVNSPVRAFRGVGGTPLFIKKALGARIWDADGNEYIDYVGSWGPMILGHAHPKVLSAVRRAAKSGTSFGAPTDLEIKLAERVKKLVPSVDLIRMTSSGTEAAMGAVRLARGCTGRPKIIKFDGCYHGHGDSFLVQAGSGALTLGTPDSPGVLASTAENTLSATFNDLASVRTQMEKHRGEVAALIIEPVVGNMGVIPPQPGFLEGLRELCTKEKVLLIFDEVMTGFRVAPGGAQQLYNIRPDLSVFGKVIGGGLPVGAFGGKRKIMESLAPLGPVYQAGTLSGNPLAMAAGLETLKILGEEGAYDRLEVASAQIEEGLRQVIKRKGCPLTLNRVGSMSCIFFNPGPVTNYQQAKASDTRRYATFFHSLLAKGIYLAPSQFEAAFVSLAHSDEDIEKTIRSVEEALAEVC
jgi:glutamate-1-semialdehyde 2,1-aminomutase